MLVDTDAIRTLRRRPVRSQAADLSAAATALQASAPHGSTAAFGPVGAGFLAALDDAAATAAQAIDGAERRSCRRASGLGRGGRRVRRRRPARQPPAVDDAERPGHRARGTDSRGRRSGRPGMVGRGGSDRRADRSARPAGRRVGGRPHRLEPHRRRLVRGGGRRRGRVRIRLPRRLPIGCRQRIEHAPGENRRRSGCGRHGRGLDCATSSTDSRTAPPRSSRDLDEPGVAEELHAEAHRALDEAVAVVDELRAELRRPCRRRHARTATRPDCVAAPAVPPRFTAPAGFGGTPRRVGPGGGRTGCRPSYGGTPAPAGCGSRRATAAGSRPVRRRCGGHAARRQHGDGTERGRGRRGSACADTARCAVRMGRHHARASAWTAAA